jgi:transcriptional regulator with XRE-family HTH domain
MVMNKNNSIASRLIERRAMLGLSQNALAQQSSVAPAQISRYESGKRKPSAQVISRMAEALFVPFEWLAYGDESDFAINAAKEKGEIERWITLPEELYEIIERESKRTGYSMNTVLKAALLAYENKIKKEQK